MGSTADHQHDYEERRGTVQPLQTFMIPEQVEKVNAIRPDYYRREIKGVTIDVIDIINAWRLGFLLGNALKYILRAGQKQGNSRDQDLGKAQECINREVLQGKEEIVGRCEHGVIQ
jgi:hypothetical protein